MEGRRGVGWGVTGRPSGWPARDEERGKPAHSPCFRDAARQRRGCGCVSAGRCRASRAGRVCRGWPVRAADGTTALRPVRSRGAATRRYRAAPGAGARTRRGESACPAVAARLPRPVRPLGGDSALPRPGPSVTPPERRRDVCPRGALDRGTRAGGTRCHRAARPHGTRSTRDAAFARVVRVVGQRGRARRRARGVTAPGPPRHRVTSVRCPGRSRPTTGLAVMRHYGVRRTDPRPTEHPGGCNAALRRADRPATAGGTPPGVMRHYSVRADTRPAEPLRRV